MATFLDNLDHLAAIATAVVAVAAWVHYLWGRRQKRLRLEDFLRDTRFPEGSDACSVLHLVAELGMSEAEVMDAAFRSPKIKRVKHVDFQSGLTTQVMLRYEREPPQRF